MTKAQVARLLAVCAAFDQRTSGEEDDVAWLAAIGDLDFAEARDAVIGYYQENRERIMPSDIRQRVRDVHNARLAAVGDIEIPEELADKPIEARNWLQRQKDAIAAGKTPPHAIGGAQ